jgi:hypothetical protein
MMFESEQLMRSYLEARGVRINNERVFVGSLCSFFTQGSEIHGLSGMAMEHDASPDLRGYILKDGKMMLVFPTAEEAELAGPDRVFVNVDVVAAAECWGIPDIAFMPDACVQVHYDQPLVIGTDDTHEGTTRSFRSKAHRKDSEIENHRREVSHQGNALRWTDDRSPVAASCAPYGPKKRLGGSGPFAFGDARGGERLP